MKKNFGIIGKPIKHSLSPILHNYWFKKYNIEANYSILDVKEDQLQDIVEQIKLKKLDGINITLPYKQKIVPHLDILVHDAEITSSVNTIYLNQEGIIVGENTDVFGLQKFDSPAAIRAHYRYVNFNFCHETTRTIKAGLNLMQRS